MVRLFVIYLLHTYTHPSFPLRSKRAVLTPPHLILQSLFALGFSKKKKERKPPVVLDVAVYWPAFLLLPYCPFFSPQHPVKRRAKSCGTLPTPRSSWDGTRCTRWRTSQRLQDTRYKRGRWENCLFYFIFQYGFCQEGILLCFVVTFITSFLTQTPTSTLSFYQYTVWYSQNYTTLWFVAQGGVIQLR